MALKDNGPVLMLVTASLFAVMDIFVKLLPQLPASEILFFRFLVSSVMVFVLFRLFRIRIRLVERKFTALRVIFGFFSVYFLFEAISLTSLSNAIVLFYTAPLFSIILSHIFLKEKAGKVVIPLFLVSFTGILLIIKPEFSSMEPGDIYGVLSGLFAAMSFTALKKLESFESAWTITLITIYGTLLVSMPLAVANFVMPSPEEAMMLLGTGIIGFFAILAMTFAFRYCSESEGTELLMFEAVIATILSILVLGEAVDIYSLIGFILVLSSNFYITFAHAHIDIHLHHR
ncbi:MAG: DMT family transporter [Candidatus Altiarchaeota archaeon]|nr:DMT family transporter [Candidatus Altiarchaeota archaeon]